MSLGHSTQYNYVMADATGTFVIEGTTEKRELGLIITDNLKPTSQCVKAAAKARSVLGFVRRHFKRHDPQDFLIIYKSNVRPHLEYCIQAWSPYLQNDIYCLESVQRAATRLVRGFRNVPYEDRLRILGLTTLAVRRKRGDLIECYKLRYYLEKKIWIQISSSSVQIPPISEATVVNFQSIDAAFS